METEPTKVELPKRKRRWFQFSLRTLLVAVTVSAVPLGYVGWQAKIVRERKALVDWIARNGGKVYPLRSDNADDQPPFVRRLLGDRPIGAIMFEKPITIEGLHSIQARIPEAEIVARRKVESMRRSEELIVEPVVVPSNTQFGIPDQTLLKYEPLPSGIAK
jgi:hypothetical protein